MNPDDIAADLPAPRDDEPESLRQDIVDELADHLQCALQRELLASGQASPSQQASPGRQSGDTDSEQTARQHPQADAWGSPGDAWQQVLTRFGSPATIARQLWWDAMKEKVMAQRFTAIMAAITAAAAIAVAILLWRGIDQQAAASAAQRQSNADIMQRLVALLEQQPKVAAVQPAEDRTMRHLDLRLVQDDLQGPPAVWYRLATAGISNDDALKRLVDSQTDDQGRATLSMNRIGQFNLSITTPDGWVATTLIPMGPEHPQEVTLVVPAPAPQVKDLSIHIPRPEELSEQEYLFALTLERPARKLGDLEWYYAPEGINEMSGREDRLLVAGDGTIIGRVVDYDTSWETGWRYSDREKEGEAALFKTVPIVQFSAGEYEVRQLVSFEPLDDPAVSQRDRLAGCRGIRYEFANGTAIQTVEADGTEWTIKLPDFVWQREIEGPPFGSVSPIFPHAYDGTSGGGHGGGFF